MKFLTGQNNRMKKQLIVALIMLIEEFHSCIAMVAM
jgi:hypothetical protein